MNKVVIVSGPTGTGKTSTSIEIGKYLKDKNKESIILNFDSLCFYKELEIGTAKPTKPEQAEHPHDLIDIVSIKDDFNASHFINLAEDKIESLHKKNIIPILVGGSAFYLRALVKGMYESPTTPDHIKQKIEKLKNDSGFEAVRELLKKEDLTSYENLHANDHYRITRALEHCLSTGTPYSEQKNKMDELDPYNLAEDAKHNWDIHHIYLNIPKDEHYPLIKDRAKGMVESGLIDEVRNLFNLGHDGSEKALGSIGYKEVVEFLKAGDKTEEDLSEEIFIHTRQLAKSQRTFFNKIQPKTEYHPLNEKQKIFQDIDEFLERN
ncbi:MAG: tRNA (adenosine(37)-N6)-dimethylallyltransferase MiaA [Bacteriovoracaceae bacterium]|nr:tRNA (adenosine(37)-N6)-dimethylallyltransferase MiaA [Bacteriovoracaceae bacterium]